MGVCGPPAMPEGDIMRYFNDEGIGLEGRDLNRKTLANLLRNPVYAQAGLDLYDFFKAQGAKVVNDAADFTETNGCYLYQGRGVTK